MLFLMLAFLVEAVQRVALYQQSLRAIHSTTSTLPFA